MELVFEISFEIFLLILSVESKVDKSTYLVNVTQLNGCTNSPLCPLSDPVTYVCSGEAGIRADDDVLRWRIRNSSDAPAGAIAYTQGVDTPMIRTTIATYFNVTLTSSAGPMRSNLSFTPVPNINNYTVRCDISFTTPADCSIMIAGIITIEHHANAKLFPACRYSSCSYS